MPFGCGMSFPPAETQQPVSRIFVNSSDLPLDIFVEALVNNRPRLVRKLRTRGAAISFTLRQAQIILVDSNSQSGRVLIRNWGADPLRVVLDATWVDASIEAGRPLLEDEDWGGCKAIDDGEPIEDCSEELLAEEDVDPLPTPRQTPTEANRPQHVPNGSQSLPKPSNLQSKKKVPRGKWPSITGDSSSDAVLSSSMPPSSQMSSSQSSFPSSQLQTPHSQQPRTPISPVYPSPSQMPPPSQPLVNNFDQTFANMIPLIGQFTDVMPMVSMLMAMSAAQNALTSLPYGVTRPANSSGEPSTLLNTFIDVCRAQGIELPSSLSAALLHNHQSNLIMPPPESPGSVPVTESNSAYAVPKKRKELERTPSYSSESLASTSMRPPKSAPPETPIKSVSSARKRSRLSEQHLSTPASSSQQSSFSTPSQPLSSQPYPFLTPAPVERKGAPRHPGEIFQSDGGRRLRFYVQIEIKRRKEYVPAIKRSGGEITAIIAEADYVVLKREVDAYNKPSGDCKKRCSEAIGAGKIPVTERFIEDCVRESRLLEMESYAIQMPPPAPKPKTKAKKTKARAAKQDVVASQLPKEQKTEQAVGATSAEGTVLSPSLGRTTSPPPPPEDSRVMMAGGKYVFTAEEQTYMKTYARVLLERDSSISLLALTQHMHEKMPHHPYKSWRAFTAKKEYEITQIREEVKDARSQALEAPLPSTAQHDDMESHLEDAMLQYLEPYSVSTLDSSVPSTEPVAPHPEDIEGFAQFFASGEADDEDDDDALWTKLAQNLGPCSSAPSWQAFYETYKEALDTRIMEIQGGL